MMAKLDPQDGGNLKQTGPQKTKRDSLEVENNQSMVESDCNSSLIILFKQILISINISSF